jgi:hypothetical protein
MGRFLLNVLPIILAICSGSYAFYSTLQLQAIETETEDLRKRVTLAETQTKSMEEEKKSNQARMQVLLAKEVEFDAAKAALANGQGLKDLEIAVGASRNPTAEQILAVAALRMLTKGRDHPETLSAYQKALEMVNWSASLSSVCAAQSGIAATGRPIEVLADCANAKALVGAAEAALKPADASTEATAKPPAKAAAK